MAVNPFDETVEQLDAPPTAPKPVATNPFDETVAAMGADSEVRVRRSFNETADVSPEQSAEARRLSLKLGVPPATIRRNLADYQKQEQLARPYKAMQAETPKLSSWLETPENAAVAKDDLENLGFLEWLVTAPQRAFASTINQQRYGELRYQSMFRELSQEEHDQLESFRYQQQADSALGTGASWFRGAITGTASFLANQVPVLKYGLAGAAEVGAIGAAGGSVLPGAGTLAGAASGAGLGFHAGVLAGVLKTTFQQEASSAYDEYTAARDEFGNQYDPQVAKGAALAVGAVNAIVEAGGTELLLRSFPGFAAFGAGEIAPRQLVATALKSRTFRAAVADAVKSYGLTLAGETGQEVGQRLFTILGNEAQKYLGKPQLATGQTAAGNIDLTQQPKVTNADGTVSTVDSLSVNIDGKEVLLPTVTAAGEHFTGSDEERTRQALNEYQKTGRHLGTFDTPASADAFAKKLHEDYAAGTYDAPTHKLESGEGFGAIIADLANEGAGALQSFALSVLPGPVLALAHGAQLARVAQHNAALFTALGEGMTQSKTVQRMPEAAQNFLEHATKDGPLERVYAPIETWTQYWQEKGIDPAQVAAEVTGSRDAYDRATQTGEDLEIPTARYATKLAGTEHNTFFAQELRLKPGEMNAREAEAHLEQLKAEAAAEPAAEAAPNPIREKLTSQLEAAGVPASTADSYADLYESVFSNLGERAGVAPEALFDRYGLSISREGMTEPAPIVAQPGASAAPASGRFEAMMAPVTPEEVQGLDRRQAQQPSATIPGGIERRNNPGDMDEAQIMADLRERGIISSSDDRDAPINTTSIAAAAARMLQEDPTALARATAMRDKALAGKAAAPAAQFAFYEGDDQAPVAKYWIPTENGVTQATAARLEELGIDVPETPADTGERLNGQQLRARMLDAKTALAQTGTSDTGATPNSTQPSQGGRPSFRSIEESTPPGNRESANQRRTRREEHYNAVFDAVLAAAQELDPSVDPVALRKEFDDRVGFLEAGEEEFVASGHDPLDLLRAIAKAGGISLSAEAGTAHKLAGYSGEVAWLRESGALGAFGSYAGVGGVFRTRNAGGRGGARTGLSLDDALTSLRQEPRFAHLETVNDLLAALEDVARMGEVDRGGTFYGTDELQRRAGVNPAVKWWNGEEGFNQSAFHGSPHAFEQFSLQAIGTGEGAQSYGWGLYFASKREVAEGYRDRLTAGAARFVGADGVGIGEGEARRKIADDLYVNHGLTKLGARLVADTVVEWKLKKWTADEINELLASPQFTGDAAEYRAALAFADRYDVKAPEGRTYKVAIPEDNEYLDWDKPVAEQGPHVRAALEKLGVQITDAKYPEPGEAMQQIDAVLNAGGRFPVGGERRNTLREGYEIAMQARLSGDDTEFNQWWTLNAGIVTPFADVQLAPMTGAEAYKAVGRKIAQSDTSYGAATQRALRGDADSAKAASQALASVGIPGIKYLDGFSRSSGEGSSNYVLFDDRLVQIEEFYQGTPDEQQGDLLDTGEEQGRLPGDTGAVRDTENATPEMEAPFALTSPTSKAKGKQDSLFQERRGAIRFGRDRQMNIALFANADLSTFLHESGHFFLEVLRDLAAAPDASETIKSDLAIINAAFFTDGNNTNGHEKFARAFEAYLMKGEAPSLALRSAFARFRAWLTGVYRSIKNLNVPLDDRIRGVMDRLVATDAAIADAQAAGVMVPLFLDAATAGMSEREFALYRGTVEAASREAQETLQTKLLAEVQREQTAAWKARRLEVREQVTDEVQRRPAVQALAAMQRGTYPNGEPLVEGQPPAPMKLSKAALVDEFGKRRLRSLPRPVIYTDEPGAMLPSVAAELFGFSSADEMLTALAAAGNMKATIERETDARMVSEYGSILLDGTLAERAQAAAANETRDAVVRAEMKALINLKRLVKPHVDNATRQAERERSYERRWFQAEEKLKIAMAEGRKQVEIDELQNEVDNLKRKAAGGPALITAAIPRAQTIETAAKNRLAGTRIRDIKPALFWSAARKAQLAAVAAAAKQDFDTAILAQQQQLFNLALYREAERALDDADQRARAAKDLARPAARARLAKAGGSYLEQIDGILDRYEFAAVPAKTIEKRASLRRWVAAMEGENLPIELSDELLDDSRRINYSELTYDELVGVTDGLKQIVHLARLTLRRLQAAKEEDYNETRDGIVAGVQSHGVKREVKLELLPKDKPARIVGEWFASHTKLATFIAQLDGYVDGGPVWDALMRPINAAATKQAEMHEAAAVAMGKILTDHYSGADLSHMHDQLYIPAIGASLSKEGRLAVALNWGNAGNRQRLMESVRHWNDAQAQAILDTLDERDLRFVQASLDYINSYWPEIEAKQKRVFGIAPEKVAPASWHHARFGEQRGGYYPIAYDGRLSVRQGNIIDADAAGLQKHANYAYATTKRGYTKAREEKVNAPVRLELSVMYEHLEGVIHDLSHHEMLIDVGRLLGDKKVQAAIASRVGDIGYRQMRGALLDIALGLRHSSTVQDRAINWVKNGTTIAGLAWNVWTASQQWLGVFNGAARIGPKWVARGVSHMFRDASSLEWSARWVNDRSPMMRLRGETMNREIADLRAQLQRSGSWFDNALRTVTADKLEAEDITSSYLWLIGKTQQLADLPVWIGGYEKAMAAGETEARAIALADQGVLDSQSGGQIKDLAQVQRGGPFFRLFTAFYSYGNLLFNQTSRAIGQTDFKRAGSVGQMLGNLSLIYVAPAAVTVAMAAAFGKEDPKDTGDFLKLMGREMLSAAMNTMVIVREIAGAAELVYGKAAGVRVSARGYEGPTGLRIFAGLYNLAQQSAQMKADRGLLRAVEDVAGVLLHLPIAQVQRSIDGFVALDEGRTNNPAAIIFGPQPKKAAGQ